MFVSTFVAVTFVPGTTAPLGSVTRPVKVAVVVPKAEAARLMITNARNNTGQMRKGFICKFLLRRGLPILHADAGSKLYQIRLKNWVLGSFERLRRTSSVGDLVIGSSGESFACALLLEG